VSLWYRKFEVYGVFRDREIDGSNDVVCMRESSLHLHIATPPLVSKERSPGSPEVDFLPWFQSPSVSYLCPTVVYLLEESRL
jgi:hypothetical protein